MATTFSGMYIVSYGDGEITTFNYLDQEVTLDDTADGNNDHMVEVGDNASFEWSGVTGEMEYVGYFSCLGPVMSMNGAHYFFTEIDGLAAGSVLPIHTSHVLTLCFVGGTRVATPQGERAVEDLVIGDIVQTSDGRDVAVKWIGRQVIRNLPWMPAAHEPVCISAGALGGGRPAQDLYVSPDHGMIWEGLVVNAGAMVNGTTIRFVSQAELPAQFTYFHIETEAHEEIMVNGTPAETFIDYAGRRSFDNYDEYIALYGADRRIRELPRPRISARRQLPQRLRQHLGLPAMEAALRAEAAALAQRLTA